MRKILKYKLNDEKKSVLFTFEDGVTLPPGFKSWSTEKINKISFYLIEFVANYKRRN